MDEYTGLSIWLNMIKNEHIEKIAIKEINI